MIHKGVSKGIKFVAIRIIINFLIVIVIVILLKLSPLKINWISKSELASLLLSLLTLSNDHQLPFNFIQTKTRDGNIRRGSIFHVGGWSFAATAWDSRAWSLRPLSCCCSISRKFLISGINRPTPPLTIC